VSLSNCPFLVDVCLLHVRPEEENSQRKATQETPVIKHSGSPAQASFVSVIASCILGRRAAECFESSPSFSLWSPASLLASLLIALSLASALLGWVLLLLVACVCRVGRTAALLGHANERVSVAEAVAPCPIGVPNLESAATSVPTRSPAAKRRNARRERGGGGGGGRRGHSGSVSEVDLGVGPGDDTIELSESHTAAHDSMTKAVWGRQRVCILFTVELERATDNFAEERRIGSGASGDVFVAHIPGLGGGHSLVVKRLREYEHTAGAASAIGASAYVRVFL